MVLKKFKEAILNGMNLTLDFVGDSITCGLDHCRVEETYVAKFAMYLAREFTSHSVFRYDGIILNQRSPMKEFDGPIQVALGTGAGRIDVIKNGINGNTVADAIQRIRDFTGVLANGRKPDVTFLMFGINDAIKTDVDKYASPENFKKYYKKLLDEIKKRNPETALVLMVATYNNQSIEEHCQKTVELAEEENIPYINLHELWMSHYDEDAEYFGQGDWLAGGLDACHPTPLAAGITAKYIFDAFMKLI